MSDHQLNLMLASEMRFTDVQKLKCLEREIVMRRRVYPRWIELGKMTLDMATREIRIMEAIAEDYRNWDRPS